MSTIDNWLFGSLSLRHIAIVKSVEAIWKNSNTVDVFRGIFEDFFEDDDAIREAIQDDLLNVAVREFEIAVDNLALPKTMKDEICCFMWQMHKSAYEWLHHIICDMYSEKDPNGPEKALYFVNNITWDNTGWVDGRKVLESYVNTKETIDYDTWCQLCEYCCEDGIIRYADTVDWNTSKIYSDRTVYWYHQVYDTFPTEELFFRSANYNSFLSQCEAGLFDDEHVYETLFRESYRFRNISAIKYFWGRLTDEQKLGLCKEDNFIPADDDNEYSCKVITAYLFGQMKFFYLPQHSLDPGPWRFMLYWPWILFIDSWIDDYNKLDKYQFTAMFALLLGLRKSEKKELGIEEFERRMVRGDLRARYHLPCVKLWRIFREKSGSTHEIAPKVVAVMFSSGDFVLCKIVMEDTDTEWKKSCLEAIRVLCEKFPRYMPDTKFCDKFIALLLVTAEERKICEEIVESVEKIDAIGL